MRKILGRKFWSLGTPLGSLGPLSQGDVIVGPYGLQTLVIWGPYEPPVLVACQATAENPKSVGSWCALIPPLGCHYANRRGGFGIIVFGENKMVISFLYPQSD